MVFSAQFFVTRNLKTHGFIMIDNGNSRPKFDTNLNLSYGIKCRFFLLIWSLYHLNFGHFLVKVTVGDEGKEDSCSLSALVKNCLGINY